MFLLLTTVVSLAITTVQIAKAHAVAEAARKKAVANNFMILQGITEPLKRLGNPDLERQPELAAMRRSALAQAVEAYETFAKSRGQEPDEVVECLNSLIDLGLIHTIAGNRAAAMESYLARLCAERSSLPDTPGPQRSATRWAWLTFTWGWNSASRVTTTRPNNTFALRTHGSSRH